MQKERGKWARNAERSTSEVDEREAGLTLPFARIGGILIQSASTWPGIRQKRAAIHPTDSFGMKTFFCISTSATWLPTSLQQGFRSDHWIRGPKCNESVGSNGPATRTGAFPVLT